MDYPNILITTSLSDNRVLFDEPAKFTAKLRKYKTDNNLLRRIKDEEKKNKKFNLLIFSGATSVVLVFLLLLSL